MEFGQRMTEVTQEARSKTLNGQIMLEMKKSVKEKREIGEMLQGRMGGSQ